MRDDLGAKKDRVEAATEDAQHTPSLPSVSLEERAEIVLEACRDTLKKSFPENGESGFPIVRFEVLEPLKANELSRLSIDEIVEYGADPGYPIDFHYERAGIVALVTDAAGGLSLKLRPGDSGELDPDVRSVLRDSLLEQVQSLGMNVDTSCLEK